MIASNKLRVLVGFAVGSVIMVALSLLTGCATVNTDQGKNATEIAKAKYQQDVTFVAFEMKGVNKIEGTNICIVARSYRPPISIVPEVSITEKIMDAVKWVAFGWFGMRAIDSLAAKSVVHPEVVRPEVVTVPGI